jgi:uncharacterized protein (TIGR01244 family)
VRLQAPVVVQNLFASMKHDVLPATYDGYGSCPLTVAYGKIVLAEFAYDGKVTPSFPLDPRVPRRSMWYLKTRFLPWLYWSHMLRGGTIDIGHRARGWGGLGRTRNEPVAKELVPRHRGDKGNDRRDFPMPTAITRKLWVMPQPSIDAFEGLAERGFVTVINNRPDGEDANQPGSLAEEKAARAAGLSYTHLPVTSAGITENDARRFREAVNASPGPVVAHCRSGARSFLLWIMTGDLDNKSDDEILALAEELHLDPKAIAARLAARSTQSAGEKV